MHLSSKQQPGFVAVNLHRGSTAELWRWEIPSLGLVELHKDSHFIFSFADYKVDCVLRRLMGKGVTYPLPLKHTVWVKLETI